MCFCFDGEEAVAAYRPEACRERLAGADIFAPSPVTPGGEPRELAAAAFLDVKADLARHLVDASISRY